MHENDSYIAAIDLWFFPAFFTQGTFSFSFPAFRTGLELAGVTRRDQAVMTTITA
jgi:hypothetical protein